MHPTGRTPCKLLLSLRPYLCGCGPPQHHRLNAMKLIDQTNHQQQKNINITIRTHNISTTTNTSNNTSTNTNTSTSNTMTNTTLLQDSPMKQEEHIYDLQSNLKNWAASNILHTDHLYTFNTLVRNSAYGLRRAVYQLLQIEYALQNTWFTYFQCISLTAVSTYVGSEAANIMRSSAQMQQPRID